ncbi:Duf218 domain-containing protein [Favolaschia claudopus]|uniref:Duf218 domain-containing protein n=1 Tax=Favolaschia claudopus TaxID=2862362 RepID=A0AAW0A0D5_9AGAR
MTNNSDAAIIYDYHCMHMELKPADAIFTLCSLDIRVAERAAQLFHEGYDQYIIFSGNVGALSAGRFAVPEAEAFAAVARERGVPEDKIIVEPRATNTGENVRFTYALLQEKGLHPKSFVLVQKPYMERRTYATFVKQWPDSTTRFSVTSPQMGWDVYPDADNPRELVTSIMVGDLVRVRDYPAKGFQIEQDIPDEVWAAAQRLIAAGCVMDKHLP